MIFFVYILVCLVVALLGLNRRFGYVGALLMCLLATPVVAFVILWMTAPLPQAAEDARPRAAPEAAPTRTAPTRTATLDDRTGGAR